MSLKDLISQGKEEWNDAVKNSGGDFENPPDGFYVVQLTGMELRDSKAGKAMVMSTFTILEGDLKGKTKYDFIMLEGKLGLQPLVWRLSSYGIDLADVGGPEMFEGLFEDLVSQGLVMRIKLETKAGTTFQNVKVDRLLPNYDSDNSGEEEEVELEEGMEVVFKKGRKDITGTVVSFNEDETEAVIQVGEGEFETVAIDKLAVVAKS